MENRDLFSWCETRVTITIFFFFATLTISEQCLTGHTVASPHHLIPSSPAPPPRFPLYAVTTVVIQEYILQFVIYFLKILFTYF